MSTAKVGAFRIDPTINFGHLAIIITFMSSVFGAVWYTSANYTGVRRDLDDVMKRGIIYAPRVDALAESNKIQDERISNLAASFSETRRQMGEIQNTLGGIREDMATVRAKLSIDGQRR